MEKRVLILTAGFGEGHNAAARGLRDGLAAIAPDECVAEIHDIFAETYGLLNDWARRSYLALINRAPQTWARLYHWIDRRKNHRRDLAWLFLARHRLEKLLRNFEPQLVLSAYPAYAHLLGAIFGESAPSFRRVVCITDSITVNSIWFRCPADLFLLPNEQTAEVLRAAAVPEEKLRVTGFPVTPRFAEPGTLRQLPSSNYGRRVLMMLHAGSVVAPETIRRLAGIPQLRLTITVGRDERLLEAVKKVRRSAGRKFEIVGWSDQLPRLMLESHLLVSKAGGATVQETIAAGCPMIVNQIVPGQEEGNARLVEMTGSGVIATAPDAIVRAVEQAFADDARLWREWSQNIARLSRPKAALEIAEMLLGLCA